MSKGYSFLFGPVRSRRLGRSLGIDLVPLKVCSWDCPYCQVGATTDKTVIRREYVPVKAVLAEFDDWLAHDGQADCVTLAGGGEPTLHSRFGEVLDAIGARSKLRRILLSNGSLFSHPDVRAAACEADVVKATFSSWDQDSMAALHQPHASLTFDTYLDGLKALRAGFKGEYWLEVFVVPGLNDSLGQMSRIAALAAEIRPDHIHLNTAVRPARDGSTQPVSAVVLRELASLFKPVAEVIATVALSPQPPSSVDFPENPDGRIQGLLQRHPCTASEISASLGLSDAETRDAVERLCREGLIRREHRDDRDYYLPG